VFRVNDNLINNVYLFAYLNRREIRTRAAEVMTGSSGHRRVPISFYEDLEIPVPSMEMQMEIAKKYKNMVSEMEKIKQYIANSSSAKQAILDKYLK
jgi:type I restriction enzyme M protein